MELPIGPIERTYCADLAHGQAVQITGAYYSAWAGQFGTVAYVGADRVEVEIRGAVIPFLPGEVEAL